MAQREHSEEFKIWLDRQALLQPDGTYLIRSFWPARTVYEVSAKTKDRWIEFQLVYRRYGLFTVLAYFAVISFTSYGQPWIESWGLAGFIAIALATGYGSPFFILRGA